MPRMSYRPRAIVAFVLALLVAAVVVSVSAVGAAASGDAPSSKGGITLDAPKTVAVVGGSVDIPFSVTNSTGSAATCTVIPVNSSGTAVAPSQTMTVAPGTTSGGSFTFSYNGETKVTLNLKCDGKLIQSQKKFVTITA